MAGRFAWNPSTWGSVAHAAADFGGTSYTAAGLAVTASAGRFGGSGLVFTDARAYVSFPLASEGDAVLGFALKGSGPALVVRFMDDATEQVSLWLLSDGRLQVRQASTVLATGTARINSSVHRWVECYVAFHGSTGEIALDVDGADDIAYTTSLDTIGSANAFATAIRLGEGAASTSTVAFTIGEGYIVDTTGGVNDDFRGLVRIDAKVPTGTGTTDQWTANTGTTYGAVDDTTPDDDTTYLSTTAGSGELSSFATANMSGTIASIAFVVVKTRGKRTDAGAGAIQHYVKVAGDTDTGADKTHAAGAYDYQATAFDVQPDASAWNSTDFDAAEFGIIETT